jgi:hypothetical protein
MVIQAVRRFVQAVKAPGWRRIFLRFAVAFTACLDLLLCWQILNRALPATLAWAAMLFF